MEDMFEVEVRGKNNVYYKVRIYHVQVAVNSYLKELT